MKSAARLRKLLKLLHTIMIQCMVPSMILMAFFYMNIVTKVVQVTLQTVGLENSYWLAHVAAWMGYCSFVYIVPVLMLKWNALLCISISLTWYYSQLFCVNLISPSLLHVCTIPGLSFAMFHIYMSSILIADCLMRFTTVLWSGGILMANLFSTFYLFFMFRVPGAPERLMCVVGLGSCSFAALLLREIGRASCRERV